MRSGLFLSVLFLAGCSSPMDLSEGQVSARFQNQVIVATNGSSVAVYYAVVNPLTLALWTACAVPETCPRIPPESGVTIAPDQILGGNDAASALDFYFWKLVSDGRGGYKPDRMRRIVLQVP